METKVVKFRHWAIVSDGRVQYIGRTLEEDGESVAPSQVFTWSSTVQERCDEKVTDAWPFLVPTPDVEQ